MNTTEKLEAGYKLDALVAEKVMGWVRNRGSYAGTLTWKPDSVMLLPPTHKLEPDPTSDPVTYFENLPTYSTDIAAAWAVVEAMRAKGWHATLADSDQPGRWYARFHNGNRMNASIDASAPLAICYAALAALEA